MCIGICIILIRGINLYSVSKMAKKLNISAQTLRNWNKSGKLMANRGPSGRMFYTEEQYLKASGNSKYISFGTGDISFFEQKNVLITGGTGSLGHALTNRLVGVAKKDNNI